MSLRYHNNGFKVFGLLDQHYYRFSIRRFVLTSIYQFVQLFTGSGCGKTQIDISNVKNTTIFSPKYPSHYPIIITCVYFVTGGENTVVALDIVYLLFRQYDDVMSIGNGHNPGVKHSVIARVKSVTTAESRYLSDDNKMWIVFSSPGSGGTSGVGEGFIVSVAEHQERSTYILILVLLSYVVW